MIEDTANSCWGSLVKLSSLETTTSQFIVSPAVTSALGINAGKHSEHSEAARQSVTEEHACGPLPGLVTSPTQNF